MKKNLTKTNSSFRHGCFNVGRTDVWGNYCPFTGEYYLACNSIDPYAGDCTVVLASACLQEDDEWQVEVEAGYSYEVARELLQLGHLTSRTLEQFLEEGGEVWWNQPASRKE